MPLTWLEAKAGRIRQQYVLGDVLIERLRRQLLRSREDENDIYIYVRLTEMGAVSQELSVFVTVRNLVSHVLCSLFANYE